MQMLQSLLSMMMSSGMNIQAEKDGLHGDTFVCLRGCCV